jgi:hypothetical protein
MGKTQSAIVLPTDGEKKSGVCGNCRLEAVLHHNRYGSHGLSAVAVCELQATSQYGFAQPALLSMSLSSN